MQILATQNQETIELTAADARSQHWIETRFLKTGGQDNCHFEGFVTLSEAQLLRLEGFAPCFVDSPGWRKQVGDEWQAFEAGQHIAAMYSKWHKPGTKSVYLIAENGVPYVCANA